MVLESAVAAEWTKIGAGSEVGPYQRARQRLPLGLVVQTMTPVAVAMAMIAMVQLRQEIPLVPLGMSNFEGLGQRRRLDLPVSRMVRPDRRRQHHPHLSIGAIPPQYPMDDTTDKGRQQKMSPNQLYPLR